MEIDEEKRSKQREYNKKYYEDNKEKLKEKSRQYRINNREKVNEMQRKWYNSDPNIRHKIREKYKDKEKLYKSKNRQKINETNTKWRKNNPDKVSENAKRHYSLHRDKILNKVHIYRQENIDKINRYREEYREQRSKSAKKWRENNPDKIKEARKRRRARINKAPGNYTEFEWEQLCLYYMNQCLSCGDVPNKLVPDHVIPIARGGSNDIENIQPLCSMCNARKHTKTIDYRI